MIRNNSNTELVNIFINQLERVDLHTKRYYSHPKNIWLKLSSLTSLLNDKGFEVE
jgi:hypothetical protein